MIKLFILFLLTSSLTYAAGFQSCVQQLKKDCGGRSFSSAVLRCSWTTKRRECSGIFSLLYKYELKKIEDKQIATCKELPDCNEYSDTAFLARRATAFNRLMADMKKTGFTEEMADKAAVSF